MPHDTPAARQASSTVLQASAIADAFPQATSGRGRYCMVIPRGARLPRATRHGGYPNKEYRMDWVYELVCTGAASSADDERVWSDAAARAWSGLPGLSTLDLYRPIAAGAHDPFNN